MKTKFTIILYLILGIIMPALGQDVDLEKELNAGIESYFNAQFEEALLHLEKVVPSLDAENADSSIDNAAEQIYFLCLHSAFEIEDYRKALEYANKALSLKNLSLDYKTQILISKMRLRENFTSISEIDETVNQLLELYKANKNIDILQALFIYYADIDFFEGILHFEKDVEEMMLKEVQNKENIEFKIQCENIYAFLGVAYQSKKDYNSALKYLLKALECVTPMTQHNLPSLYNSIAWIYNELDNREKALEYQKKAIESQSR